MASPMSPLSRHEVSTLVRQVQANQLLNRQLSSICQINGLKSTGVKADLQQRIVDLIQQTATANDISRFHQVRQSIANAIAQRSGAASKPLAPRTSHQPSPLPSLPTPYASPMPSFNSGANNYHRPYHASADASNSHRQTLAGPYSSTSPQLTFHPSPFYQIETPVSTLHVCEAMAQHRNSINIAIKLNDHPALQQRVGDRSYRIMVFCASDTSGPQNITFPNQSEIRVNGGEIKANLRGLKNKPGSTRPVDITSALRLRTPYTNNIEFIYALTTKKFYLVANLCKVSSVPELVSVIATRRRIPKESVMREFNKKAQDPDVVATSQVLSLKCPLSFMRLQVPCRSLGCTHVQCFDATSYLQLQEQGPQWQCPICNKPAPFDQLAVDEYVRDILENTPSDLDVVSIAPSGRWSIKPAGDSNGPVMTSDPALDDDELEISEISTSAGRRPETPKRGLSSVGTTASGSRAASDSLAWTVGSAGSKRAPAPVIDLTASSDDEEPLRRPRKRQSTQVNRVGAPSDTGLLEESPVGYHP